MRISAVVLLILFIVAIANAKPIVVVVIDSGYSGPSKKLCTEGHYDAVADVRAIGADEIGHGTKIVETIEANAGDTRNEYCMIVIKVFGAATDGKSFYRAYQYLMMLKPDIVNMSYATSQKESHKNDLLIEEAAIRHLTTLGSVFFIAAGNVSRHEDIDFRNLDQRCHVFPACSAAVIKRNVYVVGGTISKYVKVIHPQSFRGKLVSLWRPFCNEDLSFCGTSYSTAVASGEAIENYFRRKLPPKRCEEYVATTRREEEQKCSKRK